MRFSEQLLSWYDVHRRALPWRGTRDPYCVWLSEIMLQQTQTETVKSYYARFLERFPDVFALADAPEDAVLKLWEGLGYYSRARNLHAAAKQVAGALNGRFPEDADGLRRLPGVGPYAANAIASIAYGEPAPALDGNQARVLSRVLAWEPPIKTPFDLLAPAQALISKARPGDYNQALMDLGAMVCMPRQALCDGCPVADFCKARLEDAALEFPRKPAPTPKREEAWSIVLLRVQGRLLVRRRPKGLLGGLYEFHALPGHFSPEALAAELARQGFGNPTVLKRLPDSKHVFTHLVWRMQGWLATCDSHPEGYLAASRQDLSALAFPSALHVYREIAEDILE